MERRDKQAINSFTAASSGVGATKAEAGRKRPRDDSGPPNAPPRRSGPYSGLALNNLHDTNRSSHKGSTSNSRTSQPSARGPSRATQNNIGHPIASTIFYANHSKSELSLVKPQLENSTTTSVSHEASNNVLRYPDDSADLMPPENLSHKTNALMSGHPEDMYSLADIFDAAPAPASPSGGSTPELLPFHRPRKSSSADPIDIIDRPTSGPSAAPLGSTDDDPIEEIGEGDRPSQHRPGTPKRETQFQKGRVKRAIESLSQAAAGQSTLNSFLKTQPPNSAHSAFESMAKTKSSSIGIPITPGMTRPTTKPTTKPVAKSTAKPTTISGRMGKKSGLVIQQPGSSLQPVSSQRPTRPRDSGLKRQPHTAPSASVETSYLVQEWYCGNERYETSRDRQNPYWLVFDGSKLRLARGKRGKDPQVLLTLLQLDFEEFTIAQSAPENNTEEFIASIYFTVKDKCASSESWKKLSNESTFPKMLVTLDTATENDTPDWESLVRRLAGWITKTTVHISAMKRIIDHLADHNSEARAVWKAAHSKSAAPEPESLPDSSISQAATTPPPARASTHATRARTRALIPVSKNGDLKPAKPPLQDPDEIILVYPQSGTGAVNINRAELARLEPGEFLNDTLIELGLKLWLSDLRMKDPELVEQVHVFNSFFFKKLDGGRGQPCDYKSVKKWTSKLDLFQKKFIIVPINEHLHWYLAIICFPEFVLQAPPPQPPQPPARKTRSSAATAKPEEPRLSPESEVIDLEQDSVLDIENIGSPTVPGHMDVDDDLADQSLRMAIDTEMTLEPPQAEGSTEAMGGMMEVETPVLDMTKDEEYSIAGEGTPNKCSIIILDSLKGKHNRTVRILREYLQAEAQERHRVTVETKDAKSSGGLVEDKHLPAPEQPNWCDCGVYLLHYAEAFLANPLKILALPTGAKRADPQLYNQLWRDDEVKSKRDVLRDTVNKLSAEWLQSRPKIAPATQTDTANSQQPLAEGDASIMIIEPPQLGTTAKEAASNPPTSPNPYSQLPPRSGVLPPIPDPTQEEEDEVVEIVDAPETATSSDQSSTRTKATRRGTKGGKKHQHPKSSPEL